MNTQTEVTRTNVTLSAFFAAVKAATARKGTEPTIDKDFFLNPPTSESSSYYIKDGRKVATYNGFTVTQPADMAACQAETYRIKPLDWQTYTLNFDGSMYNEICEFTFDSETRGTGYYWQENRDA